MKNNFLLEDKNNNVDENKAFRKKAFITLSGLVLSLSLTTSTLGLTGPVPKFKTGADKVETTTSIPGNSSNTSNTMKTGPKIMINWPQITGVEVDKEEALKVINDSYDTLSKVDSYDLSMTTVTKVLNQEIVTIMEGQIHPKKKEAVMYVTYEGLQSSTYLKDGKVYQVNPDSGQWEYFESNDNKENQGAKPELTVEVLNYITTKKLDDGGYVIETNKPYKADEFFKVFPASYESDSVNQFRQNLGSDANIDVKLMIILDKELRYRNVFYEFETKVNESTIKTYIQYVYGNFNQGKEIILPEEVKNAKKSELSLPESTEESSKEEEIIVETSQENNYVETSEEVYTTEVPQVEETVPVETTMDTPAQ